MAERSDGERAKREVTLNVASEYSHEMLTGGGAVEAPLQVDFHNLPHDSS